MTYFVMLRHLLCLAVLTLATPGTTVQAQDDPGGNKFPITERAAEDLGAGSLAIQAVQGTAGATVIGSLPIQIDLVRDNQVIQTINTQLDEFGVVVIKDLPIAQGFRPLVRIEYGNVKYQQMGALMDVVNPQQRIRLTCYETTEGRLDWKIGLRQVMVVEDGHGIKITEIAMVENLANLTWIGTGTGDPGSKTRETVTFALPPRAENVMLGSGFALDTASIGTEAITGHMPLMPGESEFSYSYMIHSDPGGTIDLQLPQSSVVRALVVLVPDSIPVDALLGLEFGGEHQIGVTKVRYYGSDTLMPGQTVGLTLAGFNHSNGAPASVEPPATASDASANAATGNIQLITGIGMAILLIGGIAFILMKKPKAAGADEEE